ncbi:MAG: CdaR family protein [Acidobacteria bacterium]|nr:CdaR family protein [Acidobacteriota bacterium]
MPMLGRLTRNLGWKFLSLALAILLWYAIVGEPELATSVSAPIEYKNLPADLEMSSDVLDRVHLEVRGPSSQLHTTDLGNMSVVLDLESVHRPGERTFTIQQWNVNLPSGVILSRAVPAQVRVRFENRVSRKVPVRVRYSAQPPAGYRIAGQQVEPSTVRVIGPESRVNHIEAVQTDPIDLSNVVGESSFEVHTYVADSQVRLDSSPVVRVKVLLEKIP